MGDILFLAHRVPFPPNRGDKIRSAHLLRKLTQLGRVHVGCFADNDEDRAGAERLAQIAASYAIIDRKKPLVLAGVEAMLAGKPVSLTAFHSTRLESWVRRTLDVQPIDTVVIFSGQMGQYLPADFRGRFVIDLCDVDSAKFENYAEAGERVWLNRREGRLLARVEERLCRRADATIVISAEEAALLTERLQFPSMARIHVIGNGIDAAYFDRASVAPHPELARDEGPQLVFTGQMDYRPNEQAALWVIEHLLPLLRERYPGAQFHVVGRNPTAALSAHDRRGGARVWGEVADVRPFLAAGTCAIAPLLIARGVQNKVLEAMAMACPVLLTPQAATGIAGEDGRHWHIAEADPEAMAKAFDKLWSEPAAAARMGERARRFVLSNHAWDAMLAPLETLVAPAREAARNAA
jgi:sugar transferase (PEP-CTERM/EpsH1 system associated)